MKVKSIHFLQKKCPGLPIYEMEDGQLLLPFYHKELALYFWYSEKEMTANIPRGAEAKDVDREQLAKAQQPFIEAMMEIKASKAGAPKLDLVKPPFALA